MTEARFSRTLNDHARKRGVAFAWKINDRTTGGIPDHYFRGPGQALWVEAKFASYASIPAEVPNKLSEKQRLRFAEMRAAGAVVWVVYGVRVGSKTHALLVDSSDLNAKKFPVTARYTTPELAELIIKTTNGEALDEQTVH